MATTVVSILRDGVTAAGVYPTIEAWKASLPASLVTADQVHILEVEAKAGGYTLSAAFTLSGKTTDATRYIHIRPAAGHGHSGVWDTSKVLFVGTMSTANTALITGATHTCIFEGLQVEATIGSSTSAAILPFASAGGAVYVIGNLIKPVLENTGITAGRGIWVSGNGGRSVIANNTVFDFFNPGTPGGTGYRGIYHSTGNAAIYNNTIVNCGTGFESTNPASVTYRLINNLVACDSYNASRLDYVVGAATGLDAASTNNASSDTTAPGSNSRVSQTFTFQGAGASNFKLSAADAGAKGYGADLSADSVYPFSTDATGQTRTTPWDIGADAIDVVTDTIAIATPVANTIVQRTSGTGSIVVTGTYAGTPTGIRARLVLNGTSTIVSGFDWATVVAAPSGNAYTFSLGGVPDDLQWYQVEVSYTNITSVSAISGAVAVGELIAVVGQSNADALFGGTSQTGNASGYLKQTNMSTTAWSAPVAAGAVGMGNDLVTALGVPVGLINTSVSGTSITSWVPGGAQHTNALAEINAGGGKVGAFVWVQGEYEAQTAGVYASYLTSLGQVFDTGFRAELSQPTAPVIMVPLGQYNDGGTALTAGFDEVRRAQHEWGAGANNYIVERIDCEVPSGSIHLSNTAAGGAWVLGKRCAAAIAVAKGVGTEWRGPAILKINKISSTVYDVILTHRLGTDITPSTAITGFTVRDPGAGNAAIGISSAARTAANTVRITLSAAPVAVHPTFSYLLGASPVLTGAVKDNSALTLPLGWTYEKPARTPASVVNLPLTLDGSTPAASLSGLKWALFAETSPAMFSAPVSKGTAETTDGSGVLSLDISTSDIDAGATAWLVVTNSDGTTTQSPSGRTYSGPVVVA